MVNVCSFGVINILIPSGWRSMSVYFCVSTCFFFFLFYFCLCQLKSLCTVSSKSLLTLPAMKYSQWNTSLSHLVHLYKYLPSYSYDGTSCLVLSRTPKAPNGTPTLALHPLVPVWHLALLSGPRHLPLMSLLGIALWHPLLLLHLLALLTPLSLISVGSLVCGRGGYGQVWHYRGSTYSWVLLL